MVPRKKSQLSTSFKRNKIRPTKSGKHFKQARKIRKKASRAVADSSFSLSYLTDSRVSTPVTSNKGKRRSNRTPKWKSHQKVKTESEGIDVSGTEASLLLAGNVEEDHASCSTSTSYLAHMFRNPHMTKESNDPSSSKDSCPSVKPEVDVKEDYETIDITGYQDETKVENVGMEMLEMLKAKIKEDTATVDEDESNTIVLDDTQEDEDDDVIVVNEDNFPSLPPPTQNRIKPLTPATLQKITTRYPSSAPDFIPISRGLTHQRSRQTKRLNTNVKRLRSKVIKVAKPLASSELKPGYRKEAPASSSSPVVSHGPTMFSAPSNNDSQCCGGLRPIVIDGSNVAMSHGHNTRFSVQGIEIVVRYFQERGHTRIVAFVPQFRSKAGQSSDKQLLDRLVNSGHIVLTPSREVDNVRISSYDDTYVLDYAAKHGGIVVTRDNFRDLVDKKPEWREVVESRILMQTFVGNDLMFPHDPVKHKL